MKFNLKWLNNVKKIRMEAKSLSSDRGPVLALNVPRPLCFSLSTLKKKTKIFFSLSGKFQTKFVFLSLEDHGDKKSFYFLSLLCKKKRNKNFSPWSSSERKKNFFSPWSSTETEKTTFLPFLFRNFRERDLFFSLSLLKVTEKNFCFFFQSRERKNKRIFFVFSFVFSKEGEKKKNFLLSL